MHLAIINMNKDARMQPQSPAANWSFRHIPRYVKQCRSGQYYIENMLKLFLISTFEDGLAKPRGVNPPPQQI